MFYWIILNIYSKNKVFPKFILKYIDKLVSQFMIGILLLIEMRYSG